MTPNDGPICDHRRAWCFEVGCQNGTLESAILSCLGPPHARNRFWQLVVALNLEEDSRRVDRELQKMRRKGLIEFRSPTWQVLPKRSEGT